MPLDDEGDGRSTGRIARTLEMAMWLMQIENFGEPYDEMEQRHIGWSIIVGKVVQCKRCPEDG